MANIPRRLKVINAYKELFKTPAGKTVLQDMMARFHMCGPVFDMEPIAMAHKEGQRDVVLFILDKLNFDDKQLLQEIEDAHREEKEE